MKKNFRGQEVIWECRMCKDSYYYIIHTDCQKSGVCGGCMDRNLPSHIPFSQRVEYFRLQGIMNNGVSDEVLKYTLKEIKKLKREDSTGYKIEEMLEENIEGRKRNE